MAKHGEHSSIDTTPTDAPRDDRREHLEHLAAAIEVKTNLRARVVSAPRSGAGTTTLHVVNSHAHDLHEIIGCDLLKGGW